MSKYIKLDELTQGLQTGKAIPTYTLEELNTQNLKVNFEEEAGKAEEAHNAKAESETKDHYTDGFDSLINSLFKMRPFPFGGIFNKSARPNMFDDFIKKSMESDYGVIDLVFTNENVEVIATSLQAAKQLAREEFKVQFAKQYNGLPSEKVLQAV